MLSLNEVLFWVLYVDSWPGHLLAIDGIFTEIVMQSLHCDNTKGLHSGFLFILKVTLMFR